MNNFPLILLGRFLTHTKTICLLFFCPFLTLSSNPVDSLSFPMFVLGKAQRDDRGVERMKFTSHFWDLRILCSLRKCPLIWFENKKHGVFD